MDTIYSHSKLAIYERCPLAFQYKYIDKCKLDVPYIPIERFLGDCIHITLQKLYEHLIISPKYDVTLLEIINDFEYIWKENYNDSIKLREGQTQQEFIQAGHDMLELYFENNYPFTQEMNLCVEERLLWEIDGFKFIGFVDRISAIPEKNKLIINDYKTSSTMPEEEDLKKERQLVLYKMAIEEKYPEKEIELVYHFLRFGKKIKIDVTEEEQENIKKEVLNTVSEIQIDTWEKNFKSRVGERCEWCDYVSVCNAYKKKKGDTVFVQTKLL